MTEIAVICGGRDYRPSHRELQDCIMHLKVLQITEIYDGNASGDSFIAGYLYRCGYDAVHFHKANWKEHGKAAGPIRNQEMIDLKPSVVIVFEGGRGTEDTVNRAKSAGIRVIRIVVPLERLNAVDRIDRLDRMKLLLG